MLGNVPGNGNYVKLPSINKHWSKSQLFQSLM